MLGDGVGLPPQGDAQLFDNRAGDTTGEAMCKVASADGNLADEGMIAAHANIVDCDYHEAPSRCTVQELQADVHIQE
eukprot:3876768-Pyramimonas_sp.AAC.1